MLCRSRGFKVVLYVLATSILWLLGACDAQRHASSPVDSSQIGEPLVDLMTVSWIHGAEDCDAGRRESDYVEWQQVRYQVNTFIFRQNKCSNYEAPFVYLFIGTEKALLIDTGATVDGGAALVDSIRAVTDLAVIVAHSHGHGDHRLGDDAFRNSEGMTVVDTGAGAVREFFGFENWPEDPVALELGARKIELLPIPGHAEDDLAFYDPISKFVVTGDTLYPGRLYIGEWQEYRASISRLATWIENKSVLYVMGTHVEMSKTANVDYPIGTTYQPDEHHLPLSVSDVTTLREAIANMGIPRKTRLGSFILWPR